MTAGSPPAGEATLPDGWIWSGDTGRFQIAVPADWRYLRLGDTTCFQDPVNRRILGVEPYPGGADPVDLLRTAERDLTRGGLLPGYDKSRLTATGGGARDNCPAAAAQSQLPAGSPERLPSGPSG